MQVANAVAAGIKDGTHAPRRRIPSSATLSEMYGVSQRTAAEAVKILKERGLVRGVPGRGVFVLPPAADG